MTPTHIRALLAQTGFTQAGLADALNATDPMMRATQATVSRWLMRDTSPNARRPDVRSADALARLWLQYGYPVTGDGGDAMLTTDHTASSYGQPVLIVDGTAYGSGEAGPLTMDDAPEAIRDYARRAGYEIVSCPAP